MKLRHVLGTTASGNCKRVEQGIPHLEPHLVAVSGAIGSGSIFFLAMFILPADGALVPLWPSVAHANRSSVSCLCWLLCASWSISF